MIAEMLRTGEANARTAAEIAAELGTDRRSVFAKVAEERDRGEKIIASGKGLYLAEDEDEMLRYYQRARRRVLRELSTLRNLRIAAQQIRGQESL